MLWFPANCWKSLCNNYTIKQSVSLSGSWYKHAPDWLRTCSCVIQASCINVINVWQHSLGTALPGSEIYWQKSSLSTVSRWNTQWESWQIEVSCVQCLYSFIIFVTENLSTSLAKPLTLNPDPHHTHITLTLTIHTLLFSSGEASISVSNSLILQSILYTILWNKDRHKNRLVNSHAIITFDFMLLCSYNEWLNTLTSLKSIHFDDFSRG